MNENENENETEDAKVIPGAKLIKNGALVPISEGNAHILKRKDIVPCQLTYTDEGKLIEVPGSDSVATISLTGNLALMAKSLREVEQQRDSLISSMSKVKNGPEYLKENGYEPVVVENVVDPAKRSLESADEVQARTEAQQKQRIAEKLERNRLEQEKRNAQVLADKQAEEEAEMSERANREAQLSRDELAAEAKAKAEAKELEELEKATNPDADQPQGVEEL